MEGATTERVEVRADGIYSHGHKISIDVPDDVPFPFGDGCYAIKDVAMWDEELGWFDPLFATSDGERVMTALDGVLARVGRWCDGWDFWPVYELVGKGN